MTTGFHHKRRIHDRATPFGLALVLFVLLAAAPAFPGSGVLRAAGQTAEETIGVATDGLRTVGGTAPELARADTEQAWRSQAGSLLADDDSAWRDLDRDERRLLLDGEVAWLSYDDLVLDDPELADAVFPVAYYAAEVRDDDEIATEALYVNEAILALPLDLLAPALEDGEPEAVIVDPAVVLLVDDVVVGLISDGAGEGIDAESGHVDGFGRIVLGEAEVTAPATEAADAPTAGPVETAAITAPAEEPPRLSTRGEEISRVALSELPIEAAETIALIQAGGPFPFERDGITFGNFEGHLPDAPSGYYREFTVITPGLDHRGARRIITGNDGEIFYTEDHYESFVEVMLPDD